MARFIGLFFRCVREKRRFNLSLATLILLHQIDIHDPKKYEGGIMASETERAALNNVLKEDLLIHLEFSKRISIGVGGITVIMHMNWIKDGE